VSEEKRPAWAFDVPLAQFKKINGMSITKIEHMRQMTSADTSESWVVLSGAGGSVEVRGPAVWKLFRFSPDHWARLIELTYEGERAEKVAAEIKAFDKKHNTELAAYRRLKKKFEGVEDGADD
jgi:hypothetical protein